MVFAAVVRVGAKLNSVSRGGCGNVVEAFSGTDPKYSSEIDT